MGFFQLVQEFAHKREMRESKDEILFGELIRLMVRNYGPLVELETSSYSDHKPARFRLLNHPLLHSVTIKVNRWTGTGAVSEALFGSIGSVTIVGEVKNYVADPDDVLNMWKTDFSNIGKIPLLGGIKVNHQMNSILATKARKITIGDFVNSQQEERQKLQEEIKSDINELCEQLKKFKKA